MNAGEKKESPILANHASDFEALYRTMVMQTRSGIVILQQGKIVFINPYITHLYGYPEEEFLGRTMLEFIHPEDRGLVRQSAIRMLEGQSATPYRYRVVCADGQLRWVLETIASISYQGKPAILENIIDETELMEVRKKLEDAQTALFQAEKLSAIGTLAGGVVHEILNPLNILSMNIQLLEMDEWPPDKTKEMLAVSARQVARIEKIARDLSAFAKPSKGEFTPVNINALLESVITLVAPKLRLAGITLEKRLAPDLPVIWIDQSKMWQVIINLMGNAADAMENEARKILRVTTGIQTTPDESFMEMVFSDTGRGIDAEHINRIFEPFFTTKEPGRGTGLGLSIAFGIIKEHKGSIRAQNNEGGGASFIIKLPVNPA
jgi:PAS domain S-box-containing protein